MSDSCNTRRLRPLIPKPHLLSTSATATTNTSSPSSSCSSSSWVGLSNGEELFPFHNHSGGEQRRRELGAQVSSRWNPTPDQLRTLEDLYRRGMRTPTAEQIQYITAQLRRYGKIEGKNVFYWFQNHKARERQKRRRRTEAAAELDCCLERKDSGWGVAGSSWIGFEQPKNVVPTNCGIRPEETILVSREEREREAAQSQERSWKNSVHIYEDITAGHQNNTNMKKTLDFIGQESSNPVTATGEGPNNNERHDYAATSTVETLQLFPLYSDTTTTTIKNNFTLPTTFNHSHHDPVQFFQFLPLKN